MAVFPRIAAFFLVGAVAACSPASPSTSHPPTGSSPGAPNARTGFGAAGAAPIAGPAPYSNSAPAVQVVDKANFESPSRNITCVLTPVSVRCDIVRKNWEAPPRPAACRLGWGHGLYLDQSTDRADFVCADDTVVGTATMVLPYGSSLRAGDIQCDSGNAALRCQSSGHGFTLAVADYNLF